MARETDIEWCDSTLNLQMGCDGCELWTANTRHCYAGTLTERYGGRPGWPESFDKPALFLDRLDAALRWPDLTGTKRPDKPWLDGCPRMVFLNDMGDTFTESLHLDWLAPLLPRLADSPHVWMLLTKRARRMHDFSHAHPLPPNVWPGVSVTTARTLPRVGVLTQVRGGGVKWVSAEPLLEAVNLDGVAWPPKALREGGGWSHPNLGVGLVIVGGESGPGARPCDVNWIRALVAQCRAAAVPTFVKQLGSHPVNDIGWSVKWKYQGRKGADMGEWPEDLKAREFPREGG